MQVSELRGDFSCWHICVRQCRNLSLVFVLRNQQKACCKFSDLLNVVTAIDTSMLTGDLSDRLRVT